MVSQTINTNVSRPKIGHGMCWKHLSSCPAWDQDQLSSPVVSQEPWEIPQSGASSEQSEVSRDCWREKFLGITSRNTSLSVTVPFSDR